MLRQTTEFIIRIFCQYISQPKHRTCEHAHNGSVVVSETRYP